MKIYNEVKNTIIKSIPELSGSDFDIQPSPENQPGEIGLACFRFAQTLHSKPVEIAEKIAALDYPETISEVTHTGPYVNFSINRTIFSTELINRIFTEKETFGSSNEGSGRKVILEHTSINPNASPHIGRARNGLIGDTIAHLLRFEGYDVNVHYYVNDIGKQIGLLVLQTEGVEKLNFDEALDYYVKANKRAGDDPEFEAQGIEMLSRMEKGDSEVAAAFKRVVDVCLEGQLRIFKRLGFTYDTFDRESTFLHDPRMNKVLAVLEQKGSLFTDEQGRKVADLKPLGYKEEEGRYIVLIRANGSTMYMYRDIAYTLEKAARGNGSNMIVLGEDHKMYFKQLKTVLNAVDEEAPDAIHYSHIILKEGKMSTRNGTVVLLEDFLDEAIRLAKERVDEQCGELPSEERAEIARKIGIGAVRFSILSVRPNRNVVFDWDSALSFTGDSGPYIQYSCTRISSILRKYKTDYDTFDFDTAEITHDAEWNLIFRLARVNSDISMALDTRNTGIIANAALDIARKFSVFYNECPVLLAPDKKTIENRIKICIATRQVLENLLGLLGIELPERM